MSAGTSGLLAVCFTDLAGSTELMGSVGDRGWDRLRTDHFSALREALTAHAGREVKNTGDGMLAVFGSAAEAVDAAVAMEQAVDVHARRAGVPLAMRVGIALGDVTHDADDVFGTPVVEAARLVAAAGPGQILCTAVVRAVAGTRSSAPFTPVGALELKGLAEPVEAFEVFWERAEGAVRPLPPLLTGTGRVFVGRVEQLGALGQAWKESAAGDRRVVLLGGEPGIGKTRLAAHLAGQVAGHGALVLAGRCDEDLGVPYQPFVEALRHHMAHTTGPPRLGRHAGELVRLIPELPDRIPDLPPPLRSDVETERYRLFDAVAAWLADASAEASVLLVLDDLHWAAKPTLLLLRHVLQSAEPMRLLVVATYRDTDIGRGHPLAEFIADIHRIPGAVRLPVRGLDGPEVAAFIEAAAGHDLDEESAALARLVWRETEGNAFFVTEVLRNLLEVGAVEQRDGRWTVAVTEDRIPVPESVRDVIGRRLSRLSEEANRVLACAAVIGLEFEPAVVEAAGAFTEEAVLAALEEAMSARLVVEVPGVVPRNRFTHALVRDTLYSELSAARRTALHRHVAEALETLHQNRLDDHLPALAHHWARASAPAAHTERAVEYAARAGDRALAQLAHDEAVAYYRSALELLDAADGHPDEGRRLTLLLALGEAQRRAGEPAHRETLLEAAHLADERGDAGALARAVLANRGGAWTATGGVDHERIAALRAALAAVPDDRLAVRAQLLGNLAAESTFVDADADADNRRILDEALSLARRSGDPATLAGVLQVRFRALPGPEAPLKRATESAELLAAAETLGDPVALCYALLLRGRAAIETGERDEVDQCFTRAERIAQETGQPALLGFDALYRAGLAEASGWTDAVARLRQAVAE
ncbi:MAG: AAA family ATPase, partial [Actinobacteria bacterium]|nr:AAA family ATPase [Actinomycetota bacterium]